MKMLEINNMTLDEVKHELEELEEAYANLRFQKATHQLVVGKPFEGRSLLWGELLGVLRIPEPLQQLLGDV